MREPFWREARKCWFVKDQAGRFIKLDPDKKKAWTIWHRIAESTVASGDKATVLGLCGAFLRSLKGTVSEGVYKDYFRISTLFAAECGGLVADIDRARVSAWLKAPKQGREKKPLPDGTRQFGPSKQWSLARQRDAARILKRIWRWGHDEGHIAKNPLAQLKLESPRPRKGLVDNSVHAAMVQRAMSQDPEHRSFALYLIASRSGARPQQIREVTAANVFDRIWVFESHKTAKKTGKPLIVYLSPCLQTLTKILVAAYPDGPLFRSGGKAWRKDTIVQRMCRTRKALGLSNDVIAYAYRHTFATNSLLAGNSLATVAALMGHQDTSMVSRVYGHLDQHQQHLLEAVARKIE